MIKSRNIFLELAFIIICLILIADQFINGRYESLDHYFMVSAFLSGFTLVVFVVALGHRVAMIDLLGLLSTILWLLMPAISYAEEERILIEFPWLHMPLEYEQYFSVALPGTLMLLIGLYIPFRGPTLTTKEIGLGITDYLKSRPHLGFRLVLVGFLGYALSKFAPGPLQFVTFLISQLVYVGTCYLFFSPMRYKWIVYLIVVAFTLKGSLDSGMFGSMIFWIALIGVIFFMRYPFSLWRRFSLIFIAGFSVILLESVKTDYRAVTWYGEELENSELQSNNKLELMSNIISNKVDQPTLFSEESTSAHLINRFNQGRVTAMAIDHTPRNEPYAEGETIFIAAVASFVPRFLWPNKPIAGGKENFERFTGQDIVGATSMNIAPLGDAYVNFGRVGGAIFLLFYGLFFNVFNRYLIRLVRTHPTLALWMPIIWVQGVVVETDVVTVFNHLLKSSIFIVLCYFMARFLFKIRL